MQIDFADLLMILETKYQSHSERTYCVCVQTDMGPWRRGSQTANLNAEILMRIRRSAFDIIIEIELLEMGTTVGVFYEAEKASIMLVFVADEFPWMNLFAVLKG